MSVTNLVIPAYPQTAMQQAAVGTAQVGVAIDKHGSILSAVIRASSGNQALDQAAVAGASASSYAGGISGCSTQGGNIDYEATLIIDFTTGKSTVTVRSELL